MSVEHLTSSKTSKWFPVSLWSEEGAKRKHAFLFPTWAKCSLWLQVSCWQGVAWGRVGNDEETTLTLPPAQTFSQGSTKLQQKWNSKSDIHTGWRYDDDVSDTSAQRNPEKTQNVLGIVVKACKFHHLSRSGEGVCAKFVWVHLINKGAVMPVCLNFYVEYWFLV